MSDVWVENVVHVGKNKCLSKLMPRLIAEVGRLQWLRLKLDNMDESKCLVEFRFLKRLIPVSAEVLQIPNQFSCYQRPVSSCMEGLCILLKRLSYPWRYSDMIVCFGRPVWF